MKKLCVVQSGKVINIGSWDYQETREEDGTTVINNPMPEDAIQGVFEVEFTADERWVLASNYQELRKPEYPSIGDQLDAIWKGGEALEEMKARISAIKEKYQKPRIDK